MTAASAASSTAARSVETGGSAGGTSGHRRLLPAPAPKGGGNSNREVPRSCKRIRDNAEGRRKSRARAGDRGALRPSRYPPVWGTAGAVVSPRARARLAAWIYRGGSANSCATAVHRRRQAPARCQYAGHVAPRRPCSRRHSPRREYGGLVIASSVGSRPYCAREWRRTDNCRPDGGPPAPLASAHQRG